jgi:hypothetical protein
MKTTVRSTNIIDKVQQDGEEEVRKAAFSPLVALIPGADTEASSSRNSVQNKDALTVAWSEHLYYCKPISSALQWHRFWPGYRQEVVRVCDCSRA